VYEAHLLRRTYREGGKVRNETLANLSRLPRETIELVRRSLRGEQFLSAADAFEVERSLPHGHVAAVLGMARQLELARLLDRQPSPERARVLSMICQQVLAPGSKLACTRALGQSTLAEELAVEGVDADELYSALDWLGERQRCFSSVTRATAAAARSRSSTACSATTRAGRSRSRSSRAASTMTRRCPPRSRSSAPASASARWC